MELGGRESVLIRRSALGPRFLFRSALVALNVRFALGWMLEVMDGDEIGLLIRGIAGRGIVCESGMRNVLAREARTGENGRIVWVGSGGSMDDVREKYLDVGKDLSGGVAAWDPRSL